MITINNTEYTVQDIKVTFGKHNISNKDKKRTGQSPFIQFHTNDNIFIGIETTYDKEWWQELKANDKERVQELKANDKKNIAEYISDISYEDENGWISLITGKHTCYLEKINYTNFRLELTCIADECDEHFDISIKEDIIIDL